MSFSAAVLGEPRFGAGDETLESRLFRPDELPWGDIAFPSVTIALEQYLRDPGRGQGPVHLASAAAPAAGLRVARTWIYAANRRSRARGCGKRLIFGGKCLN